MVKGWQRGKVEDLIARLDAGVSVNGEERDMREGEIGVLKVSAVSYGAFSPSQYKTVTKEETGRARVTPKKGQIIISRSNTEALVGASAYIEADWPSLFLPDKLWQTVPQPAVEFDMKWLAYLLSASYARYRLSKLATGTSGSMKNITKDELLSLDIEIPPFPEQCKIAEILRTWDEAIEAATKLVTTLNARREALRTKLITEAGIEGRPTVFGEFLKESRILGSDGASARKITVKLYGKGAVPKSDKRDGSTKTRYYRRSPGQLIYSKLDFLNGAFSLIPDTLQGYESSLDLPAFDISEHVNPKWLIEYLTRPAYYTAQLHLARGQRKARRIAPDDFLASPVKLPQRDRQDEVAEVLAVADSEIVLREAELDTLTHQKRGLMQKLLTGEWRVNTTDFCHAEPRGRK